jgi:hypothetical protein
MDIATIHILGFDLDFVNFRGVELTKEKVFVPILRADGAAQDARLRDFTMNSLFYNFSTNAIEDWTDGLNDLTHQIVRCPLNAMSDLFEYHNLFQSSPFQPTHTISHIQNLFNFKILTKDFNLLCSFESLQHCMTIPSLIDDTLWNLIVSSTSSETSKTLTTSVVEKMGSKCPISSVDLIHFLDIVGAIGRLSEDPHRLLRGIRLATQLQFTIAESICVVALCSDLIRSTLKYKTARGRIETELTKMIKLNPVKIWATIIALDLPPLILRVIDDAPHLYAINPAYQIPEKDHLHDMKAEVYGPQIAFLPPPRSQMDLTPDGWGLHGYKLSLFCMHHISQFMAKISDECPSLCMKWNNAMEGEMTILYKAIQILPLHWGRTPTYVTPHTSPFPLSNRLITRYHLRDAWVWTKKASNTALDLIEWAEELHSIAHRSHSFFSELIPEHQNPLPPQPHSQLLLGRVIRRAGALWVLSAEIATAVDLFYHSEASEMRTLYQFASETRLASDEVFHCLPYPFPNLSQLTPSTNETKEQSTQQCHDLYQIKLPFSGNDLMTQFGQPPGKQIGIILENVADWLCLHPTDSKQQCKDWLTKYLQNKDK